MSAYAYEIILKFVEQVKNYSFDPFLALTITRKYEGINKLCW